MTLKLKSLIAWLLMGVLALAACAPVSSITAQTVGRMVDHTFEFDALRDSRDVEILQYRYGDDGGFNTRSTPAEIQSGKAIMSANTTGDMLLGKDLYVKWRIKSTGQVYEDTVDLTSRLPYTMKRHRLRFIVEAEKLFVYVISYETYRPYFSPAEADRIRAYAKSPREKALSGFGRNRVILIYPERHVDPHVPADLLK